MEDSTDLTDELEDFVHKINPISKSRLIGALEICVIPGLAIEKTENVYRRMIISYNKTDEDHGVREDLWEDSDFDRWFDGEDDNFANDGLLEPMGGSRSCCFTLILKDPDHESLAFMIALVDPVLLMGDEEVPCFVNGHDQVVVELDPTDDFQLFIRVLESLRDGTVFEVRGVHLIESVGDFCSAGNRLRFD